MAAAKKQKKRKQVQIEARDILVENRTLLGILADLAEQAKANEVRSAEARERSARAEELAAEAARRSAAAEEGSRRALETIGALLQDFHAYMRRTDARLEAVEKPAAL